MPPFPDRYRILIPFPRWTPVRREIIESVLGRLREKRAALAYLILYDRAWHGENRVNATVAEMSRWMGMDERTVVNCLSELERWSLIVRIRRGVAHSQINKPSWRVPLSEFTLDEEPWIPVPRFVFTKYCPAFPNAVLLIVLLHYQHMSWQNMCWPGVPKLCRRTGWSENRVRHALRTMGHEGIWRREGIDLPWPIEISYSADRRTRHFRVRAVSYRRVPNGFAVVEVSNEFRRRFRIKKELGYTSD